MDTSGHMTADRRHVTCDDCFFRRAQLCAIPGNTPCPTFRPAERRISATRVTAAAPGPRRAVAAV